ncbi:MAG: hypothetical protein R3E87_23115 [Burkholderiaceae bacterium]
MRRGRFYFGLTSIAILTVAIGVTYWPEESLQGLRVEGERVFEVGRHRVSIETRPAEGEPEGRGRAMIIVRVGDVRTEIESWFETDEQMDIRPAYVSFHEADDDPGRDLLIWRPRNQSELVADRYVSSRDGTVQALPKPMVEKYDLSADRF